MKHLPVCTVVVSSLLLFASPGLLAADLAAGKEKAATCAGCHGANGRAANPQWPNLAGQNKEYLIKQLKDFKAGNRKNDLMSPMAQSLSDEDVENVAAWFSSLPCQ